MRRRRLPSYIRDIIRPSQLSKTYWHSARTPGLRENIGSGLSSLPNRIVGPGITATQPTPSEQPIWRGDRLEFAGDDFLNVAGFAQDPDDLTIAGVVSFDGYGSTRCIFGHRDGTGAFVLVFYFRSTIAFRFSFVTAGAMTPQLRSPNLRLGRDLPLRQPRHSGRLRRYQSMPQPDKIQGSSPRQAITHRPNNRSGGTPSLAPNMKGGYTRSSMPQRQTSSQLASKHGSSSGGHSDAYRYSHRSTRHSR